MNLQSGQAQLSRPCVEITGPVRSSPAGWYAMARSRGGDSGLLHREPGGHPLAVVAGDVADQHVMARRQIEVRRVGCAWRERAKLAGRRASLLLVSLVLLRGLRQRGGRRVRLENDQLVLDRAGVGYLDGDLAG